MSFYSYSILYNNFLSLSLSLYLFVLSLLSLFLFIRGLSFLLSAYLYVGHLSHILYGLSLFSFVYILSFFLSVRGLSLLLTFYIYYLSSYPYGGYPSYLLFIYTVFLPIRIGAVLPTYFLRGLSTLFVLLLSNLYLNTYSK